MFDLFDITRENVLIILLVFIFCLVFVLPKIYELLIKQKENKLLLRSGIRDIDAMSGYEFEEYLSALFSKLGYTSVPTPKSGDFGADLILNGKKKIVIQAKRYGVKNKVGLDAVREIYASAKYYQADECWVITNSLYTKQAVELANACEVKLIDRYELQKLIVRVNPKEMISR